MGLGKKNAIMSNRPKNRKNNSKRSSLFSLGTGMILIALGWMSFSNISGNPKEIEQPITVLTSSETTNEKPDIVIVITPSEKQMERLRKEGRY